MIERSLQRRPLVLTGLLIAFGLAAPSAACQARSTDAPELKAKRVEALEEIQVGALVSFEKRVTDVYGNGAFRLEPNVAAASREAILVVPEDAAGASVTKDEVVRLVGTVKRSTPKAIQRWHGLHRRAYAADFDSTNLLVATAKVVHAAILGD